MCKTHLSHGEGTSLLGNNDPDSPQKEESNYHHGNRDPPLLWHRLRDVGFGFALCALIVRVFSRGLQQSTDSFPLKGGPIVDLKAPPMGFMSWERFRCQVDCAQYPDSCINEQLYVEMADALVTDGYAEAGYRSVIIDDCWTDGRDSEGTLQADATRFPRGMPYLAEYLHSQGLQLGLYADAGIETCAHYAGSQGHEEIDARTFGEWGVDYLKLDGCNIHDESYRQVYTQFGRALKKAEAPIVLSCSWPAYMGDNEGDKPFSQMYQEAGCNTWRNYKDVDNTWHSLQKIILHWADYWKELQSIPDGSFNDADMLLVGDDHYGTVLPLEQARLQMGFWAMIASPLFIGGDVRTIAKEYRDILLNQNVIAINQDPSRKQADCVLGCRGTLDNHHLLTTSLPIQVWSKSLHYGKSRALAFLNVDESATTNIAYNYSVEGVVARCVDLWSDDPEKDVCGGGQGATTEEWKVSITSNDSSQGVVVLQIEARQVGPTSHRLLRIDYFCEGKDCTNS